MKSFSIQTDSIFGIPVDDIINTGVKQKKTEKDKNILISSFALNPEDSHITTNTLAEGETKRIKHD